MLEFQSHFAPNVICNLRATIGISERVCFCERRRLQIDTRPSVIASIATLNRGMPSRKSNGLRSVQCYVFSARFSGARSYSKLRCEGKI